MVIILLNIQVDVLYSKRDVKRYEKRCFLLPVLFLSEAVIFSSNSILMLQISVWGQNGLFG